MEGEYVENFRYLQHLFYFCTRSNKTKGGYGFLRKAESRMIVDRFNLESYCKIVARELFRIPPILNFYIEDPMTAAMTAKEVRQWRKQNGNVTVITRLRQDPKPVLRFYDAFKEYDTMLEILTVANFEKPTPIQSQCWPIIMKGYNCVGISQYGSGKTLTYLMPAYIHVLGQFRDRDLRLGPSVLIITPTWEMADFIMEEIQKVFNPMIKAISITGAGNRKAQIRDLKNYSFDIVVGTMGRLNDLMLCGHLVFASFTYIVVDDAHVVREITFDSDIYDFLFRKQRGQQVLMFSNTKPLLKRLVINPTIVIIENYNLNRMHQTKQSFIFTQQDIIVQQVFALLSSMNRREKTIVFCTKSVISKLVELFIPAKLRFDVLKGIADKECRETIVNDICEGSTKILLTTNIMARSLRKLNNATKIINVEFPYTFDEYVYRIDRLTDTEILKDRVTTFFTEKRCSYIKKVTKVLKSSKQPYPEKMDTLDEISEGFSEE